MAEELKKVLSFRVILIITINSIMGTGIFFLPAFGATVSGPASLVSWGVLSIISIYISMCFAELVSMYPTAGGIYEFCKQAYGRFTSFLIGWATVLAGNITIAMLIVGAIVYLLPSGVSSGQVTLVVTLICIAFIGAFNYIAYRGMQTSAFMLVTFGFITLGTLFSLIIPSMFRFSGELASGNLGNLTPFFVFPMSSIVVTIFFIAETFFGWETTTFLAEETKDAERVMPVALILGTSIIAIICMLFVLTTLVMIPINGGWENFPIDRPLADIASALGFPSFGVDMITILVYLSIIGSVAGWVVSAPRLILALCRDKLFPGHFGAIHPEYGTPYKAIAFQTVLTSILVLIGVGSYHTLLHLLLPIALILYALVIFSLVVLRYKQPDKERPYKQPLGIVGPILTILFLISLIIIWAVTTPGAWNTILLGISFIAIGIPVYFLIEMYYDPAFIRRVDDNLAYVQYVTENLWLPRRMQSQILTFLGDVRGKTVLDFGCSVGTLTKHLAQSTGPHGKVYATNLSLNELKITQKRMKKMNVKHARLIHDVNHATRVHPLIPHVDVIVSVGMLSYVQDVKKVLKELNAKLNDGGRFCFVDYGTFFHIIPNVEWIIEDKKIVQFFRECGFVVRVMRKQGLFWDYVFVYGFKGEKSDTIYI